MPKARDGKRSTLLTNHIAVRTLAEQCAVTHNALVDAIEAQKALVDTPK